jgi:uncharacterized protein YdaU (DUF1376 family)
MSLPYFPLYPTDFEAKTSHLTMLEDGAYNRLLRLCWMTPGCSLPDDEAWIMRRVRAFTDAEREAVVTILAEFFEVEDGRLFSPRLRKEALLANERHSRRVDAGKKGGRPSASLKTNDKGQSNAQAMPKQPEPEPEPEPDIREGAKAPLSPDGDGLATIPFDEIAVAFSAYNTAAAANGWGQAQVLNKTRRSALRQRLKEAGGLDGWHCALDRAASSDFVSGRTPEAFRCDLDFLLQQKSFTRLMEGKYDNRTNAPSSLASDPFLRAAARRMAGRPG